MDLLYIILLMFIGNGILYYTIKSAVKAAMEEFYKESKMRNNSWI